MPRLALIAVALSLLSALTGAGARAQQAQAPRTLGRLEQESVEESLAALGLKIDPAPQGKIVGTITVVNQEVFSRRDWYFQWFNIFHRTTRPEILRRELLIKPGAPYDDALVEESTRNLQSPPGLTIGGKAFSPPELSSVVAIVPVMSPRAGVVDLLVVTRDVWSLRFNTNFEFQQNTLSLLQTSLSENNLFGWRKYLSFGFNMDLGAMAIGPTFFDPNIAGTRLTMLASASLLLSRASGQTDGDVETFALRYPLYALASRWGGGVDVTHQDAVLRSFRGSNLRLQDLASTPEVEALPYTFRRRITAVDTNVTRSFGQLVIQRITLGHRFDSRRSLVLADFPGDAALARAFLDELTPISERRSEAYVQYDMFTARYVVLRDLDTFDLRENRRLGPALSLRAAYGAPELGADLRAFPLSAGVSWTVGPGGGLGSVGLSASGRLHDGRFIDQRATGQVYLATPLFRRVVRVLALASASAARADTQRAYYYLGGDTGLRGYAIGDFRGTSVAVAHVEVRTVPLPVASQRLGTLLFYDVGDAGPSLDRLFAHHDLGFGLRWLIPQLNSSVIRFDWAFATQSTAFTRAGFPGRLSAGFQQVF